MLLAFLIGVYRHVEDQEAVADHAHAVDAVATLLDQEMAPGAVAFPFDGRDTKGRALAAGVYHYRLTIGETELSERMVLVR